jgi:hypothetical protein
MIQRFRPRVLAPCVVVLSAILFAACSTDEAADSSSYSGADPSTSDMSVAPTTDSGLSVTEPAGTSIPPVEEVTAMGEITDEFLASAPLAEGECGSVAAEAGATRLTNGSLPEFEAWATSIKNGEIEPPADDPYDPQNNIGDLASFGAYKFDFTVLAKGDVDRDGLSDALVWVRCQHGGWAGKYPLTIYLSSETSPREIADCYFNYFDSWMYAEFQQTNIPTPNMNGSTYPDRGPTFFVKREYEDWNYVPIFEYENETIPFGISSVAGCEIGWSPETNSLDVYTYVFAG